MANKKERKKIVSEYWSKPMPQNLDVVDRGDHLKITSCSSDVTGWWLGTLRAVYPQDHYSGDECVMKMHPEVGVTLQLNRCDGTLRIKGKKHLQWFKNNFYNILHNGSRDFTAFAEMSKTIDKCLALDDGNSVTDLLSHLPPSGAFKHGPTYIYRLWRGLLDKWIGMGANVYVISPLLDSRRLADILFLLVKHRLTPARVHVHTLAKCDGDTKFSKVLKDGQELLKYARAPNRRRLIADERICMAAQKLDAKFGRFFCKMIAVCHEEHAEVLITSASFHKLHFDLECGDITVHFKLSVDQLVNSYLAPLGLARQVNLESPFVATPARVDTTRVDSGVTPSSSDIQHYSMPELSADV